MIQRLFVYGTLAPNRPNEHILKDLDGSWTSASVRGILKEQGWGSKMGYPGIELNNNANEIKGLIFKSENLLEHWNILDKFEGNEYKRVLTDVTLQDSSIVSAYIYTLR